MNKNKKIIAGIIVLILGGSLIWILLPKSNDEGKPDDLTSTPKAEVNLIPISERPYITLQPLAARNELEMTIYELKKPAESVEVAVEYNRNKGTEDAVLYNYDLKSFPYKDKVFLGSRSAGGHITYHEDVIGGKIRLDFKNEDYILETPWRYDDTQNSYSQLSTSDAKFQLKLEKPISQKKVLIMTSPGLPKEVEGNLLAGPYNVSTVGKLPQTKAQLNIHLNQEVLNAVILGWDGENWQEFEAQMEGKTVTSNVDLLATYIAVEK